MGTPTNSSRPLMTTAGVARRPYWWTASGRSVISTSVTVMAVPRALTLSSSPKTNPLAFWHLPQPGAVKISICTIAACPLMLHIPPRFAGCVVGGTQSTSRIAITPRSQGGHGVILLLAGQRWQRGLMRPQTNTALRQFAHLGLCCVKKYRACTAVRSQASMAIFSP